MTRRPHVDAKIEADAKEFMRRGDAKDWPEARRMAIEKMRTIDPSLVEWWEKTDEI